MQLMPHLELKATPLAGLFTVERHGFRDERGAFTRLFCAETLAKAGWIGAVVQMNHSLTQAQGTVRGMHFQHAPHAEFKLVSCLRGRVFDVAVDLRPQSSTYLQWHAAELSADNGCAMLIPPGFAHGFQTLTAGVELIYAHSSAHCPDAEGGIHALDSKLHIAWPLPVQHLSMRDQHLTHVAQDFKGVQL
jgi:dTDP-4-dehydrorhamnose 3,5-epimerase